MAKKPISQKRAERQQQENQVLQRVFNAFLLGMAAECYLFIVYRNYVTGTVPQMLTWVQILRWGGWLGLGMLAVGAVLAVLAHRQGAAKRRAAMCWVAGAGLFLAAGGWLMTNFYPEGVTVMCVLVPVVTLLALVYFLFQRECFFCTLTLAGTILAVWVCGNGLDSVSWRVPVLIGAAAGLVILAALAVGLRKVQRAGGKLLGLRVFSVDCDYRVPYGVLAVCGVSVGAVLVYMALSYYLLWALGILLFAELVYYTTKLM